MLINKENCNKKIKVFLVDDHAMICDGLAELINLSNDIIVCGKANDITNAMSGICHAKPDVAIVDLILKESSGFSLINEIVTRFSKLPILVLSMLDELIYAERALKAGAMGYIMKDASGDKVLQGIRSIAKGKKFVSEELTERMLDKMIGRQQGKFCSPGSLLTNRELEIFNMTGNGLNSQQISKKLHISVKTVETHHFNIKAKLGLRNVNELIEHAVKWVLNDNK